MSRVPIDLEEGEAFFRMRLDDDGIPCFTCGLFPEDDSDELNNNEILTLFMAGMVSLLKNDVDVILSEGVKYLKEGNKLYDFIVDEEDQEYYGTLTDEQIELLRNRLEEQSKDLAQHTIYRKCLKSSTAIQCKFCNKFLLINPN